MMSYASNEPTTRIAVAGRGRVAVANQPHRAHPAATPPAPVLHPSPAVQMPPLAPTAAPTANGAWAVAALIFFWPLAFVAFSRSLSVPMLLAQGRVAEAHAASNSVARLGKIAVVCGLIAVVLLVVVQFMLLREAASLASPTTY